MVPSCMSSASRSKLRPPRRETEPPAGAGGAEEAGVPGAGAGCKAAGTVHASSEKGREGLGMTRPQGVEENGWGVFRWQRTGGVGGAVPGHS